MLIQYTKLSDLSEAQVQSIKNRFQNMKLEGMDQAFIEFNGMTLSRAEVQRVLEGASQQGRQTLLG